MSQASGSIRASISRLPAATKLSCLAAIMFIGLAAMAPPALASGIKVAALGGFEDEGTFHVYVNEQTIYHDAAHPSHVLLPVIPQPMLPQ